MGKVLLCKPKLETRGDLNYGLEQASCLCSSRAEMPFDVLKDHLPG
jgi:hypothetical protein